MRKEIENRLIRFCGNVYRLTNLLEDSYASNHLKQQIIRSATSAALNYGETQGAVSKKDFIHKSSLVLKELRETHINLQIMDNIDLCTGKTQSSHLLDECNQLVSIFHKTVVTAKSNLSS